MEYLKDGPLLSLVLRSVDAYKKIRGILGPAKYHVARLEVHGLWLLLSCRCLRDGAPSIDDCDLHGSCFPGPQELAVSVWY